jgi:peptidoglycan pentaglycine glycine transferase (the first glycine)
MMQVTHITADRREEWNAFVAQEPSFALLQSWEWGEFKEKLGWTALRVAAEQQGRIVAGAQILVKPAPLGLASIAYIPRGPVGNWLDEAIAPSLLAELHRVARCNRAIFLKVEPPLLPTPATCAKLQQHNFRASHYPNQPQATIVVDLNSDLDDILKSMRKKTRQYIKQATAKGVTIRIGGQEDLPAFYNLMQITGRRSQFAPRMLDYYEHEWQTFADNNQTVLLMAFHEERLLAVRTAYYFGRHAAEFHAGSLAEEGDLHPNYLLVWEAIKWAKAQGCASYDLWGIPNEISQMAHAGEEPPVSDRADGLWGVYRFKSGFSKNIISYVGAYDYVYSPLLYASITNKFFNGDTLDRIATRLDAFRRG